MAKQYKIRWTDQDTADLTKAVKNFNAKINRLAKRNPSIKNLLPGKVSTKKLKSLIATRNDLKREIRALERFSRRGAEKLVPAPNNENNVMVTKWQKEELIRRVALVNRKRKLRMEELFSLPETSRGKELGYTVGQAREFIGMGNIREIELRPLTAFTRTQTPEEIRMKYSSAISQTQGDYFTKRDYELRENYIKGLKENYSYEDVKDIISAIEGMDIKDFLERFFQEGGSFEFASPNGYEELKMYEYEGYVEGLKSTWL